MMLAVDEEVIDLVHRRWWHLAACDGNPAFTVDPAQGPVNNARAQARHICMAHCPVLRQCLSDVSKNPPMGVVQAGLIWENWGSAKPLPAQPPDPGCGPWCRKFRDLPNSTASEDTVGDRILALRMARGWTSTQLAQHAGVSQTTISRLERGLRTGTRRRNGRATLSVIAAALGVTVDELRNVQSS